MQVTGQPLANLATNQINAHKIMTTLGNYYVSKTLRRFDKLNVHRPHRGDVLLDYRINRTAALGEVALQAANEPNVIRRIHENFDIHLFEQTRLGKNQNAFYDHNRLRFDA